MRKRGDGKIQIPAGNDDLDMIQVNVFRPDNEIQDPVIGEDAEEETGIYIRKNATRTLTIGIKDYIKPETGIIQLTLNTASNKITLYEGTGTETLLSFPYTWDATPSAIPKTLTLKGEQTSNTDKDIILILTGQANPDNISTDTAIITVFDIDLDWDGLGEDAEEETGIYIPLNVDDDNSDTILDKNQSPVFGENDMKKLIIRRPSPSNLPGFIALTISSGSSKIRLWEDTSTDTKKVTEITYKNYNISEDLQSDTWLWTEGYTVSTPKEVELKITYQPPSGTGEEDKVKATVIIGRVLIDPGHGGSAPGRIGPTGLKEKDVNLDIALRLKDLLENAEVPLDMTRTLDETVDLDTRNQKTRDYDPSFFSIHNNGTTDSSVRGTETFVPYDGAYLLELTFANQIQSKVHSVVLEKDRGVRNGPTDPHYKYLYVLDHDGDHNNKHDGNLCEVTFISNSISENRLKQDSFKQAVAEAMKKAILKVLVENISYPKQPNP
ncbi:MAG TPA: N-acetylmuramoyl-L-alanine amidase [Candidatus Ratteibacteria bacterium]|nr:N-acetylmuramoyl-L-alanine amidase [Candidatus Ratteibacteria bacterium]